MSNYEEYRDAAKDRLGNVVNNMYTGETAALIRQAQAQQGIGLAILALAEALRPEPTRVTLTVNTDEVKAAVVDALEGQR